MVWGLVLIYFDSARLGIQTINTNCIKLKTIVLIQRYAQFWLFTKESDTGLTGFQMSQIVADLRVCLW